MTALPDPRRIHPWVMRRLFNCGGYTKKLQNGQLKVLPAKAKLGYASPNSRQPSGTRSTMLTYVDLNNQQIAKVHVFVTPEGKVGASGFPDPKSLLYKGEKVHCFSGSERISVREYMWASLNALWGTVCRWINFVRDKLMSDQNQKSGPAQIEEVLRKMLNTPPKPHATPKKKSNKPGKK